jgi:hypothetical protein
MTFYENFFIVSLACVVTGLFFLNIDSATCFVLWLGYTIAAIIIIIFEQKFVRIYNALNKTK